jgi:hypothetical protein
VQSFTPAAPPEPMPVPIESAPPVLSAWQRLKANLAAARTAVVTKYQEVKAAVTTTTRMLSTIMPLRRIVFVAIGVGIVAATLGYAAPAGVAAVLAGIGGVITAAVAQVGSWFRRSLRSFQPS